MKNKKKTVLIIGILLVVGFILVNALLDYNVSHAISGWVAKGLGIENTYHPTNTKNGYYFLRKSAHFIEYALFGFLAWVGKRVIEKNGKNIDVWCLLFWVLAVGVLDEFFQSLSSRTGTVSDVLLDFFGGVMGMVVAAIAYRIFKNHRNRIGGNRNE